MTVRYTVILIGTSPILFFFFMRKSLMTRSEISVSDRAPLPGFGWCEGVWLATARDSTGPHIPIENTNQPDAHPEDRRHVSSRTS